MAKSFKLSSLRRKLGKFITVENMKTNKGTIVPNQFLLTFENGKMFKSYDSVIGIKIDGWYYFSDKHAFSRTTNRFSTIFCGVDKRTRESRLESGFSKKIVM